jgi:hypothetical protein
LKKLDNEKVPAIRSNYNDDASLQDNGLSMSGMFDRLQSSQKAFELMNFRREVSFFFVEDSFMFWEQLGFGEGTSGLFCDRLEEQKIPLKKFSFEKGNEQKIEIEPRFVGSPLLDFSGKSPVALGMLIGDPSKPFIHGYQIRINLSSYKYHLAQRYGTSNVTFY